MSITKKNVSHGECEFTKKASENGISPLIYSYNRGVMKMEKYPIT